MLCKKLRLSYTSPPPPSLLTLLSRVRRIVLPRKGTRDIINNGVLKENMIRSLLCFCPLSLKKTETSWPVVCLTLLFRVWLVYDCPHHMSYTSRGQFMKNLFNLFKFRRVLSSIIHGWSQSKVKLPLDQPSNAVHHPPGSCLLLSEQWTGCHGQI